MSEASPDGPVDWLRWVLRTDHPWIRVIREMVSSVVVVVMVGLILFAISGIWPPMVAVESGSMEPHMQRGDLVFVMAPNRFPPEAATGSTGIVTYRNGIRSDYTKFGDYGDVIVYRPNGMNSTPIIHRARFWVNASENWYDKADARAVPGSSCSEIPNCPAPHAGFITKGDANPLYDQTSGISGPVRPAWIKGTAKVRIPFLGYVRLQFSQLARGQLMAHPSPNLA